MCKFGFFLRQRAVLSTETLNGIEKQTRIAGYGANSTEFPITVLEKLEK